MAAAEPRSGANVRMVRRRRLPLNRLDNAATRSKQRAYESDGEREMLADEHGVADGQRNAEKVCRARLIPQARLTVDLGAPTCCAPTKATASDRYFNGGGASRGRRRGSPWKPRISTSSSRSEGATTVLGRPPCAAEPKAPSAVPARPSCEFCM
jgi:hypothetical protein